MCSNKVQASVSTPLYLDTFTLFIWVDREQFVCINYDVWLNGLGQLWNRQDLTLMVANGGCGENKLSVWICITESIASHLYTNSISCFIATLLMQLFKVDVFVRTDRFAIN